MTRRVASSLGAVGLSADAEGQEEAEEVQESSNKKRRIINVVDTLIRRIESFDSLLMTDLLLGSRFFLVTHFYGFIVSDTSVAN